MTIAERAAWTIALAVIAAAAPARAQSAEADVLFRDGKKLLKDWRITEACEKLDASERLESSVGTLLNLADCREKNHQLATAWATFRKAAVAARRARDGRREKEARRREKLLAPRLSYLTVRVPEASRLDGLAILRNAVELDRALWNQSVPIDAGDYELVAAADGHAPWTRRVTIDREAQRAEVEVPALSPEPRPAPAEAPAVRAPAAARHDDPAEAADHDGDAAVHRTATLPSRMTRTRGVAIAAAVVGAAGIGVGVAVGLRGRRLEQDADAVCPGTTCDDRRALSRNADARQDARIANISFAAGGGLVATAVVLWLIGGPHVAPVVARDGAGLALEGQF